MIVIPLPLKKEKKEIFPKNQRKDKKIKKKFKQFFVQASTYSKFFFRENELYESLHAK